MASPTRSASIDNGGVSRGQRPEVRAQSPGRARRSYAHLSPGRRLDFVGGVDGISVVTWVAPSLVLMPPAYFGSFLLSSLTRPLCSVLVRRCASTLACSRP